MSGSNSADEDYDISNEVISSYLSQFPDLNFEPNSEHILDNSENLQSTQKPSYETSNTNGCFDSNQQLIFVDHNLKSKFYSDAKKILTDIDKKLLITLDLELLNKFEGHKLSSFDNLNCLVCSNKAIVALIISFIIYSFINSQSIWKWIIFLIILTVFYTLARFNSVFLHGSLKLLINSHNQYLEAINYLMYYLKEIEMVS